MPEVKRERRDHSTLRDAHAELTRNRILEAARRLFVERGYSSVSMQEIARDAGVAYQTVFSRFGGKLQLALELCASEFPRVGDTATMLAKAPEVRDPVAWLGILASFARRLYEPCAEILRFMRESGEAELTSRLREIDAARFQRLTDLGQQLERSGRLRPGLSGQAAVDVAWSLTSPAIYEQMVLDRGWTPDEYEQWLGASLPVLVLRPIDSE